ncbi:MAG: ABC transporter permease [Bacteroidota bacterium]
MKNKVISAINLAGLVIGMAAALFIWQYVNYERSYDKFNEHSDRIFRVRTDRVKNGVPFMQFAAGTACAAHVLKDNFAEVEDYVKLYGTGEGVFSAGNEVSFRENRCYFATPSIFDVFSFELLKGNKATCLSEPFNICLSESMAQKYFGDQDPLGKNLIFNGNQELKVTGVFADCPGNSHLKFDMLASYITFSDVMQQGADGHKTSPYWDGFYSYVLLQPGTDWKALEARIPQVLETTYDTQVREAVELYLQPLEGIHLTSNYLMEAEANGDGEAVSFLFIIGIIILLIAWFNYINLSTARSELRAREVGVRKVVGSTRNRLIGQFLTEAALINSIAILLAFLLVQLLTPFFESLIGKPLPYSLFSDTSLLGVTVVILLMGTLLAGLYPAFLLSSFKPISVLKTNFNHSRKGGGNWLRKGLVICQFVASVGLIATTFIIYNQLQYMQNAKLGVNIDQMLIVKGPEVVDTTFDLRSNVFGNELSQLDFVKGVAASSAVPGREYGWTAGGIQLVGAQEEDGESFHAMAATPAYTNLYEMDLVTGRSFSEDMRSDETACLLNEKGIQLLGLEKPEEAIGRRINFWGTELNIIGVLKDFHHESIKSIIEPMIMRPVSPNRAPRYYSVKVKTEKLSNTIAAIEAKWNDVFPGNPFDYFFLDDFFNKQYESDQRFGRIFILFSVLAVMVSCLGLFALVAFMTERRRKEIGIRKVLGASVPNIIGMISRDFIVLFCLSLLLATPIAWYFMNGWLNNFARRIDIQWWIFILSGLLVIGIAFTTVGLQSWKAARANPADSLRNE